MGAHTLDKIDLTILKILQEDGRITNLQLSTEIGLSPAPTLERVKKLEQGGYIKSYHATVNEKKLNLGIKAFTLIRLSHHKSSAINDFVASLREIDEIIECHHVTGGFDFILKIMVKDIEAYQRFVLHKLSMVEEISQMQTLIILDTDKDSKAVPLDYTKEIPKIL
ncbi:MAG: Lrp/AsnC family transcriptional regulator [Bacteroidia bacterium]|nr:Lrp/AsnC family transcriptional regulator [Bacteroidia bacterium]